jgi:hypothetical protein
MIAREMQIAFEMEASFQDPTVKPTSYEIFWWINRSIEVFIKTRWDGNNPKGEGFEQTQKRIDDLRTLVKEPTSSLAISAGTVKPNSYTAPIPADYMFTLGEEVTISYTVGSTPITSREGITETSVDKYSDDIINPFSEHILHNDWARPLRLFRSTLVELITDGTYSITGYYLRYLCKPAVVALPSTSCDLPDHTHYEIVKGAVKIYLESIKSPRYQTYNNEIVTSE